MLVNAFCTAGLERALERCDSLIYCGSDISDPRVTAYKDGADGGRIYIPDMCDEDMLERACDHIVSTGASAFVRAAYELNEAGIIEARYKLSPIMLLHKLGVLDRCIIGGGVCLDNDDLDLMAQEGAALVVTPTASAGYGHGFAPVVAALRRGIRVGVGTFDGRYNPAHDIDAELSFLKLVSNAEMRGENSLTEEQIASLSAFSA